MKRILILEDEESIRDEIVILLSTSGYTAETIDEFDNSVEAVLKAAPDMVLLDINLPYKNGKDILREVRQVSDVPVIMVTSSDAERDELISMGYGADDYITKPYNPTLLLLRIGNIFKRLGGSTDVVDYRDVRIDFRRSMIISRDGNEMVLSKNEMLIMSFLYNHKGQIVSRDDLMTDLWNNSEYLNDNALTVNISRLRGKLADVGIANAIETRKGQGYILV